MSFSFADYLSIYRNENLKEAKDLILNKWKLAVPVLCEAFNEIYADKEQAIEKIRTELSDPKTAPKNIDVQFVKENIDYLVNKIENLTEGQIKIVINNASKGSEPTITTESSKKKKGKKTIEEEGDAIGDAIGEPSDKTPGEGDGMINDQPNKVETEPTSEDEEQTVTIKYDEEEELLTVTENNEEELERMEISDKETIKTVVEFMQDFYSQHDYTVTLEGLDEILADEDEKKDKEEKDKDEDKEKEEKEGKEKEEKDESPEEEDKEKEEGFEESFKLKFSQILSEDFQSIDGILPEIVNFEIEKMIGKLVCSKGKWYSVVEEVENDPEAINVLDESGNLLSLKISDIEEFEQELPIDTSELSEDVVKEFRTVLSEDQIGELYALQNGDLKDLEALELISEVENLLDEDCKKCKNWLKKAKLFTGKGAASKPESAKPKKGPTNKWTHQSGMKTMQKILNTNKAPAVAKKAPPSAALTAKPSKPPKKILDVKKPVISSKTQSGGPAGKVEKPNQVHLSVKLPSVKKKGLSKNTWSEKGNGKTQQKILPVKKPTSKIKNLKKV